MNLSEQWDIKDLLQAADRMAVQKHLSEFIAKTVAVSMATWRRTMPGTSSATRKKRDSTGNGTMNNLIDGGAIGNGLKKEKSRKKRIHFGKSVQPIFIKCDKIRKRGRERFRRGSKPKRTSPDAGSLPAGSTK